MSEGEITTYTGIQFDPLHPDPETIRIQDIAHALSLLCRGNGHVKTFYSVGQHCLSAAKDAAARGDSRQVILGALLHDATECYLSDVPHPYKVNMPRYRELEDRLLQAVLDRTEDEEERCLLAERIRMLSTMFREARELAVLTERYYERGYRRNVKYTI